MQQARRPRPLRVVVHPLGEVVREPGWDDARADATDVYGAGDTWFLRYHPDEIDDGQGFTDTRSGRG